MLAYFLHVVKKICEIITKCICINLNLMTFIFTSIRGEKPSPELPCRNGWRNFSKKTTRGKKFQNRYENFWTSFLTLNTIQKKMTVSRKSKKSEKNQKYLEFYEWCLTCFEWFYQCSLSYWLTLELWNARETGKQVKYCWKLKYFLTTIYIFQNSSYKRLISQPFVL